MSVDIGAWLRGNGDSFVRAQAPVRAQIQWARIMDNPLEIRFMRGSTLLPAQTVRLEWSNGVTDNADMSGDTSQRQVIVYGIQGHPELDDTDVKIWDTFVYEKIEYTVTSVNRRSHGSIKAYCDGVGG